MLGNRNLFRENRNVKQIRGNVNLIINNVVTKQSV